MWLDAIGALVGAWAGIVSVAVAAICVARKKMGLAKVSLPVPTVTPDIDVEQVSKDVLAALANLRDQQ